MQEKVSCFSYLPDKLFILYNFRMIALQIGQGTYSNVFRARDLETGRIVALKKVRFDNFEPESVRFMAREILLLRRLDHPNIIKLEGIITSRLSSSIYLVFEYMEHDISGLLSCPGIKFTEAQVCSFQISFLFFFFSFSSYVLVFGDDIQVHNLFCASDCTSFPWKMIKIPSLLCFGCLLFQGIHFHGTTCFSLNYFLLHGNRKPPPAKVFSFFSKMGLFPI